MIAKGLFSLKPLICRIHCFVFFSLEAAKYDAGGVPIFDRVILKDVIPYLQNPKETFANIMKTMGPGGRLLVIHRAAPANTLPLFDDARTRMKQLDRSYSQLVSDLQSQEHRIDVQWQIECLPVLISKKKWLGMIRDRYPPQLEVFSECDVRSGVRELAEGTFKYQGDIIEFTDRLLFACSTHALFDDYPDIQRFGASALRPFPGLDELKYKMEITGDMKKQYGVK